MARVIWPLVVLVLIDIAGVWTIVDWRLSGSITDALEGAYVGCGMFLLQIPLCIHGMLVAKRLRKVVLQRVYLVHCAGSVLVAIWANIDPGL